jgi:hypothetical protein
MVSTTTTAAPEPDNDRDGLLDACDQCPNEPETFQGSCDEDGCPDRSHICITQERVTIPGPRSVRRERESARGEHGRDARHGRRELARQPRDPARRGARPRHDAGATRRRALARARAEAVVEALVQRGVDRSRLEAVGLDPRDDGARGSRRRSVRGARRRALRRRRVARGPAAALEHSRLRSRGLRARPALRAAAPAATGVLIRDVVSLSCPSARGTRPCAPSRRPLLRDRAASRSCAS